MKIVYTLHALERLRQRSIKKEDVQRCLQKPDRIDELEEAYRCIKKLNDKVLVIVYRKLADNIIIITAFKSSKTRKYLPENI